jgi:predicted thioesterase
VGEESTPERPAIDPEGSVPGTTAGEYERGETGGGLRPGIERSHEFEVSERLLTDVGGTIGVRVLSTPGMIAMLERNAAILSYEHLPEGKATVGFEVCVKHVAAAAEGARCTAHARLREVVDGRKLRFDVEVREGERTIGVGTHERRVIEVGAVKSD